MKPDRTVVTFAILLIASLSLALPAACSSDTGANVDGGGGHGGAAAAGSGGGGAGGSRRWWHSWHAEEAAATPGPALRARRGQVGPASMPPSPIPALARARACTAASCATAVRRARRSARARSPTATRTAPASSARRPSARDGVTAAYGGEERTAAMIRMARRLQSLRRGVCVKVRLALRDCSSNAAVVVGEMFDGSRHRSPRTSGRQPCRDGGERRQATLTGPASRTIRVCRMSPRSLRKAGWLQLAGRTY